MYLIILTIVIYLCNFCWSLGAHLIDIRYKKAKNCYDCISLSACVLISRHAASFTHGQCQLKSACTVKILSKQWDEQTSPYLRYRYVTGFLSWAHTAVSLCLFSSPPSKVQAALSLSIHRLKCNYLSQETL